MSSPRRFRDLCKTTHQPILPIVRANPDKPAARTWSPLPVSQEMRPLGHLRLSPQDGTLGWAAEPRPQALGKEGDAAWTCCGFKMAYSFSGGKRPDRSRGGPGNRNSGCRRIFSLEETLPKPVRACRSHRFLGRSSCGGQQRRPPTARCLPALALQ